MRDRTERREFFRVDEELFVYYQRNDGAASGSPGSSFDGVQASLFELCTAFGTLSQQLSGVMTSMRRKAPESARAISLLDQKLGLLMKMSLVSSGVLQDAARRGVSLSANGIGFPVSDRLEPKESIQLAMILPASGVAVQTQARVERCELQPDFAQGYAYHAALQFIDLPDAHRDLLVQYALKKQRAQIRAPERSPG